MKGEPLGVEYLGTFMVKSQIVRIIANVVRMMGKVVRMITEVVRMMGKVVRMITEVVRMMGKGRKNSP